MKPNRLPDGVREYFAKRGYHCLNEQYPNFGGIILSLRTDTGRQEAACYFAKPSLFHVVSSDELRRALEFLEDSGPQLRYAVTNSRFSFGADKLASEEGITPLSL
jgi:hypothetical protein